MHGLRSIGQILVQPIVVVGHVCIVTLIFQQTRRNISKIPNKDDRVAWSLWLVGRDGQVWSNLLHVQSDPEGPLIINASSVEMLFPSDARPHRAIEINPLCHRLAKHIATG